MQHIAIRVWKYNQDEIRSCNTLQFEYESMYTVQVKIRIFNTLLFEDIQWSTGWDPKLQHIAIIGCRYRVGSKAALQIKLLLLPYQLSMNKPAYTIKLRNLWTTTESSLSRFCRTESFLSVILLGPWWKCWQTVLSKCFYCNREYLTTKMFSKP